MSKLKNIIKKCVPRCIRSIKTEFNFKKEIDTYRNSLKKIDMKKRKDKITVVFIIQYPETWNSLRTVYENLKNRNLNVYIFCIPKPLLNSEKEYKINSKGCNEAFDFFESQNIDCINALDRNGEWIDLKKYNPDYVFYSRPYNIQYPLQYKSKTVCKYAKVCLIPYAFNLAKGTTFDIVYNDDFITSTYMTFATNKESLQKIKSKFAWQNFIKSNNFEFLGFPRFDLLTACNIDNTHSYTVAWMPRWEFRANGNQQLSHFLDYYNSFIKFAKKNKEISFIFRPHPLMYSTAIAEKVLTEAEVKEIKERMNSIPNLIIDEEKDYIPTLLKADVLLADYTSLLAEYFVTGKPIIFCDNGKKFFNKVGKMLDKTFYHARNWNNIEQLILMLKKGQDIKFKNRKKLINILMPQNAGKIGSQITDFILKDYEKENKNGK